MARRARPVVVVAARIPLTNFVGRMHKIMREHDVMQEKAHVDRTPMMFISRPTPRTRTPA